MSDDRPTSARRLNGAARLLAGEPDDVVRIIGKLDDAALANVAETIADEQRARAIADGDHDAIIAAAFESSFGRDGLGVLPWVEGSLIVCPGAIVSTSRTNHRCRFVSVNDTWVWDAAELIREDKRSSPGGHDGFRAIALVPLMRGLKLDVVAGRARAGQHRVDGVVSFEVRKRELVEVGQRAVTSAGMK